MPVRAAAYAAPMPRSHEFSADRVHYTWDAGNEPVLTIESGDTVIVETRDVTDNQIGPDSTADAIGTLDLGRLYPLAGPIRVARAEPGDTLAVEVLKLCDGVRSVAEMVDELAAKYTADRTAISIDVVAMLQDLADKGFLTEAREKTA